MPVSSTGVTNGAGNGKKFVVAVLDPAIQTLTIIPPRDAEGIDDGNRSNAA